MLQRVVTLLGLVTAVALAVVPVAGHCADTPTTSADTPVVTGTDGFHNLAALALIARALESPRTTSEDAARRVVCWYGRPTGTRFTYLMCARQGTLTGRRGPDYGYIYISGRPVNRARLERDVAALKVSDDWPTVAQQLRSMLAQMIKG